jgi:hypothetical protein
MRRIKTDLICSDPFFPRYPRAISRIKKGSLFRDSLFLISVSNYFFKIAAMVLPISAGLATT